MAKKIFHVVQWQVEGNWKEKHFQIRSQRDVDKAKEYYDNKTRYHEARLVKAEDLSELNKVEQALESDVHWLGKKVRVKIILVVLGVLAGILYMSSLS